MLVLNVRDAAQLLEPFLRSCADERLAIVHLSAAGEVLTVISRHGSIDRVELPVRDIVAEGLRLGSCAMILAHNHPSDETKPSERDITVTRHLAEVGEAIGICLYDHLIFGRTGFSSMRASGLL